MVQHEIGIAEELDSGLSGAANVPGTALETDAAPDISPFILDQSLYTPQPETLSILGPGWRLWFRQNDTGALVEVFADNALTLRHAQPVKLDRFGALPVIYLPLGAARDVTVENQFGVFRLDSAWPTP